MAECSVCTRELKDGTLQWKGGTWKSCPTCSELAGVHVFLRFPKDFGWRPSRAAPGGRIPQSRCYFHREMGSEAEECRLCGSRDVVPFEHLKDSRPEVPEPAQPVPEDVAFTPEQLDALAGDLVGGIELSPEGRKFLRTHVGTERNAKNREFVLRLREEPCLRRVRCEPRRGVQRTARARRRGSSRTPPRAWAAAGKGHGRLQRALPHLPPRRPLPT